MRQSIRDCLIFRPLLYNVCRLLVVVYCLLFTFPVGAQDVVTDSVAQSTVIDSTALQKKPFLKRLQDKLTDRYYTSKYDSDYVTRPLGNLTLKVRMNQTGNSFHSKQTVSDIHSKADLSTSHKTTFSVAANYRGLGVGIAINPAKWKGVYDDYELNFNYYSRCLSLDLSYQRSESLAGDIHSDRGEGRLESGDVTLKVLNVVGYYTFNNRRFSYPAAFTQSYIQRRSAGSWLAGISYQGGTIRANDELKNRRPDAPDVKIQIRHLGIGGGYGYNWVPGKKWLLHLSFLPTFVIYKHNKVTINDEVQSSKHLNFNMIFNERAAVVYYFSPRYFAGATLVMNNSLFDNDKVTVNQNKWRARALIGMRL